MSGKVLTMTSCWRAPPRYSIPLNRRVFANTLPTIDFFYKIPNGFYSALASRVLTLSMKQAFFIPHSPFPVPDPAKLVTIPARSAIEEDDRMEAVYALYNVGF